MIFAVDNRQACQQPISIVIYKECRYYVKMRNESSCIENRNSPPSKIKLPADVPLQCIR